MELPAPPNHPTKTWPPTSSLPSFPLTLLQPHWPLLFHSHLHACCSSARNIPPCPLGLLHFSPQHYGHLVYLLSISPSPNFNRASGKQRLSLFPFLAVLGKVLLPVPEKLPLERQLPLCSRTTASATPPHPHPPRPPLWPFPLVLLPHSGPMGPDTPHQHPRKCSVLHPRDSQ